MAESIAPAVRAANGGDAATIAALARRTFFEAFGEKVSADAMARYLDESFPVERVAAELADPERLFLLAEIDGEPAGYAKLFFGAPLPEVIGPAPVKLWRLYTLREWQSAGVGSALMAQAIEHARTRGGETLYLTVNIGNARAIAFYERWGFVRTARTGFLLGGEQQEDHVMERPISSATTIPPQRSLR